jgi:hypothetical protein
VWKLKLLGMLDIKIWFDFWVIASKELIGMNNFVSMFSLYFVVFFRFKFGLLILFSVILGSVDS